MTIIKRMLDRQPKAEHMLPEMKVWRLSGRLRTLLRADWPTRNASQAD